ncbi:MAG: flagellar basal-body rod protein FlgG [Pedosphaera sp.]|nr:flagellar basal-body rod protein FlgG [Pedosphaera sp.]MSU43216.1 flagellar basal-body rod protein FlgG [Pedosphaera sp.]
MLRALYSSASGMEAQQMNLDTIANNLANVNTTGFKKSKVEFQDLLYQTNRLAGADVGAGNQVPTSLQVGHGARPVATAKNFSTGELNQTGEKLDIAIAGPGFFKVQRPNGTNAWTRDGAFKLNSTGSIVTSDGLPVLSFAGITVDPTVTGITVAPTGEVTVQRGSDLPTLAGTIVLSRFANPQGLQSIGSNLYLATPASGTEQTGEPGDNGFGELAQGFLELSNVKVVEEMVNLIKAQRAYEVNSKAIQAADEMMQMSNRLRG